MYLNSFQIKIIMVILMVLDHICKIPNLISNNIEVIFHIISRCVSVWFGYILVEGFLYTKNLKKYIIRLWSFAIITLIGNNILTFLYKSKNVIFYNNILLTLAISISILSLLFVRKESKYKYLKILLAIILMLGGIVSEGGIVVIPFVLITYIFRKNTKTRDISYLILSLILLLINYTPYEDIKTTIQMLLYNCDWFFIIVLPFIYLYNGERGFSNKFSKYFFYIFYPLHLWIIGTIIFILK